MIEFILWGALIGAVLTMGALLGEWLRRLTLPARGFYTWRCTECDVEVQSNLKFFTDQAESTHKHHN